MDLFHYVPGHELPQELVFPLRHRSRALHRLVVPAVLFIFPFVAALFVAHAD